MNIFLAILFFVSVVYAACILWCVAGWKSLKEFRHVGRNFKTVVSVIVPARNEEEKITACLQDILAQNYPTELVELLVVDDHSDDATAERISDVIRHFPGRKISMISARDLSIGSGSKKQSITAAIRQANGELIVTTDADCRVGENWLSSIVSYYESENPFMIAGPVCFYPQQTIFEKIQSIEFSGLIGIGAASIKNNRPLMCNGANLAYTKEIFLRVSGFQNEHESVSGDDTQLLLKVAQLNSGKIHFLKTTDAIVYTRAAQSLNELFQQRKRWASKIPRKMGVTVLLGASLAYFVHAGLLLALFNTFYTPSTVLVFLLIFLIKCIPEFILLSTVLFFYKRRRTLWLFLPAQLIYMVYITFIGAIAPFGSYRWKQREIKPSVLKFPIS